MLSNVVKKSKMLPLVVKGANLFSPKLKYSKLYDAYHGIFHLTNYNGCIPYKERMVTKFHLVVCAYIQFC